MQPKVTVGFTVTKAEREAMRRAANRDKRKLADWLRLAARAAMSSTSPR